MLSELEIYQPLPENYICPHCNLEQMMGFNTGTVWSDTEPPVLVRCECSIRMYYTDMKEKWGAMSSPLKQRDKDTTFSDWKMFGDDNQYNKMDLAKRNVWAWANRRKCDLVLGGPAGTGKTMLAIAAHNYMRNELGIPTLWLDVVDWVAQIVDNWRSHDNDSEMAALIKAIKEVPVLFLDDLGTTGIEKTDGVRGELLRALNDRYKFDRPTLVTTNLSETEFYDEYPRIGSRMLEERDPDVTTFVPFDWRDLRRNKNKEQK